MVAEQAPSPAHQPPPPPGSTKTPGRSGKARSFLAAGVVAAVATVGVGGAALASPGMAGRDSSSVRSRPVPADDLGDTTLDELADQLAELGLEVNITPAGDDTGDSNGGDDDGFTEDDPFDSSDPFEEMSDAEIDALSDEEFEKLLDEAGLTYDEGQETEDGPGDDDYEDYDDEAAPESLGTFPVKGDSIDTSGASPKVAKAATKIWERFVKLIPADQRTMVSSFSLDPAEAGGAWVTPDEKDPNKWSLGVSEGLGDELDYVLIHEFGHLLTLQAKEVPPGSGEQGCKTYFTGEGCALKGSTFGAFVQKFWPQSLLDELAEAEESGDDAAFEAFYDKHRDEFVTDYATTNPGEDLAETFAVFVTTDKPTGSSVADQKVQMLWADADMVALRDQIRANQ